MAQTGYTPISIYYSATSTNVPTAGNLVAGELAINTADGKLFYKDSAGVVQTIASKATGSVAGSTTQIIYNNAGAYAGSANMTFNGTTLTLANDASISGLTVGKGGGSITSNTVLGAGSALSTNVSGTDLTAIGRGALSLNTASYNSAFGRSALENNSTGANNTAVGYQSLVNNTTASNNTAVGYQAGYANTTGTLTAVGRLSFVANTTGIRNVGLGATTGLGNTTGSDNIAIGYDALFTSTTGSSNVAIGTSALVNSTASNNTVVGFQAGYTNTTGVQNTLVGVQTGYSLTTGQNNTFIGTNTSTGSAGYYVTTGSKNSIFGAYNGNQGGLDIRTSSNYIVLSDGDGNPRGYFDNNGAFFVGSFTNPGTSNGFSFQPGGSLGLISTSGTATANMLRFFNGNGNVGSISTSGSLTAYNVTSDRRLKENINPLIGGLNTIIALKPSEYNYITDPSTKIEGFIADELQAVVPHAVTGEPNAVDEEGKPIYQAVDASFLIPHLVSAIQELKAEIDQLKGNK
jgi:hypothetical protein